jgi:F-box-like
MPPGRNLARQAKQPHQLARLQIVSFSPPGAPRSAARPRVPAVSSLATPANTLGGTGASTRRCGMLCAPFGCSVFDLDVGTFRGPSVIEYIICADVSQARSMYVLTNVPQRFADWCAITVCDVGLSQVTIDLLPDDVFLDVFDYFVKPFQEIEGWLALVHVCRRWRTVIFGSPHRLKLQL